MIRELYTHIGGAPTRLQASTRYIDYEHGFDYVIPPTVAGNPEALKAYREGMGEIMKALKEMEAAGIPREDCAMLLPLGMTSTTLLRTNLRNLADMSHQRLCNRAYWEFRLLMREIRDSLACYSDQWQLLTDKLFVPKCDVTGFYTEKNGCGRKRKRNPGGFSLTADIG